MTIFVEDLRMFFELISGRLVMASDKNTGCVQQVLSMAKKVVFLCSYQTASV